jgi:saccharopine dehydrogenase-like NADP-dependent oxidoreductase
MSKVLLLGAGRSVYSLAVYLKTNSIALNLSLRVGDLLMENAKRISDLVPNSTYFQFDITSEVPLETYHVDLVISMLPAHLHGKVALSCLESGAHLVTASYLNPQISQLHDEVKKKRLHFVMECGLDPGIDHMSAMKLIDTIKSKDGQITSFSSYTGGLLSNESNNNPWGYKFSWNPRNVVLAGQGVVKYKQNDNFKYLPYSSVFKQVKEVEVPGLKKFESYANRNSLDYLESYKIQNCPSVFRGTLREKGFCEAWDLMLTLGLTNDGFAINNCNGMTYAGFLDSFLPVSVDGSIEDRLLSLVAEDSKNNILEKFRFLGFFSDQKITLNHASPAQILQSILEKKLFLEPHDKDMIVMLHEIEYLLGSEKHKIKSFTTLYGENAQNTAMSRTVGLPVGIVSKLILERKIQDFGITIPTTPDFYEPVLEELKAYNISFREEESLV